MDIKRSGIHFTPDNIVKDMINKVDVIKPIETCKIMENSCGNGNFLVMIVEIIIQRLSETMSNDLILEFLNDNIYGIEKNQILYEECKMRLTQLTKKLLQSDLEFKNVINSDTLTIHSEYSNMFDVVIGNPPYVRIHNMENDYKCAFDFSAKGMTDLYLIFYEISFKMLKSDGVLCYITPDSWDKSKAGSVMRNYIYEKRNLKSATILGHYNPFKNATTYTGIYLFSGYNDFIDICRNNSNEITQINYESVYINNKFYFDENIKLNRKYITNETDCIKLKNGIATLADKVFISTSLKFKLKRKVYKASQGKEYEIIFPYDENLDKIPLNEIKKLDLDLFNYLTENKDILEKRSSEDKIMWHVFGRSQSINDTFKEKIAINNLFRKKEDIKIKAIPAGELVYSGLYFVNNDCIPVEVIKDILCTEQFELYFQGIGSFKSGGYYTLKTAELENYINYHLSENKP
jgi:adenine-specific DNA-methyltransferase